MDWLSEPCRQNIPGLDYDLEAMRKQFLGLETKPVQGRYPVEYDPIRRHCHMTGDMNPLFLDPTYGAKSKYGAVIVPPPLVAYFGVPGVWPPRSLEEPRLPAIPMPGNRSIAMMVETEWHKPVKVGDRLSSMSRYADLYFLSIRLDWCAVWVTTQNILSNQHGDAVATVMQMSLRHRGVDQVPDGQKGAPNVAQAPVPPMPQPIGQTRPLVTPKPQAEQIYWEDVKEGDFLPVLEYPITETRIVEQVSGSQDFYAVHHDRAFARAAGHSDIFVNNGFMRGCLARVLTDWIGDEGWLRKLRVEMRRMNGPGDLLICTGKVVRKYEDGAEKIVECEVWAENARVGVTTPCRAWVALPSRSGQSRH
ncbi:MAG: hypothetical protein EXR67_05150 [Dehalococcoidia bacterium]|nr:hypothetical protein [Dehalococcoidia bacterium]